jgi:23S rRNA (uracil1939-C5)-methyltransferase
VKESPFNPDPAACRGEARCLHFGECGGCQSQNLGYPDQLAQKAALLQTLFAAHWPDPVPVSPSPVVWHYRNKVDPAFAPMRYPEPPPPGFVRETVLGFKRKGRWFWPLDIEECHIGPEGLDTLLGAVRGWYRAAGLRGFDSRSGEGFLRVLLVRDAKRTGERMVVLITRPGPFDPKPFLDAILPVYPAVSVYRGIFSGLADVAAAEELELLHGAPHITERLCISDPEGAREFEFRISPMSFFQTNPTATESLYSAIRAWLRRSAPETLYDLYGGSGGIAFSCADLVRRVWSVESVEDASRDGRENARLNGIDNVYFLTEDVRKYLKRLLEEDGFDPGAAAVIDPPRSGLHPKVLRRLIELSPARLLYVSCNPKILARELPDFLEHYRLETLEAFDLFPHTRHVEVLAALTAR